MPKYKFQAMSASGTIERGIVESADRNSAIRSLTKEGHHVFELSETEAKQASQNGGTYRLSIGKADFARFSSDLSTLLDAGMVLEKALAAIANSEAVRQQAAAVETIQNHLSQGASVTEAFSTFPGVEPGSMALIGSGDAVGRLPEAMREIACDLEERQNRRKELVESVTYPVFLIALLFAALAVITFVLVPAIKPVFDAADASPPFLLLLLDGIRRFFSEQGDLAAGLVLIVMLLSFLSRVRALFSKMAVNSLVSSPVIGRIVRKNGTSRYLRNLSLLLINGVAIDRALALAIETVGFAKDKARLSVVAEKVSSGIRLPEALAETHLFDAKIISLISVGDEVNALGVAVGRAADILDKEIKSLMKRILALLTPAITIFLGLVIGSLVVSVMNALLNINELAIQ